MGIRFRNHKNRYLCYCVLFLVGLSIVLVSIIPIRIAIASHQNPYPQAIFALGGGLEREQSAAKLAQAYPDLDVWVSSGLPPRLAIPLFQEYGIPRQRLHLDYHAVDTVTNFTTSIEDFQIRHIRHVFLITSDSHMSRAKAIATFVFGSQGIIFTPVAVASNLNPESVLEIIRDSVRSILWLFTGHTGANYQLRSNHEFALTGFGDYSI